jgi:hypothetical protein
MDRILFFNKIGSCLKSAVIYFDQDSVSTFIGLVFQLPKIQLAALFFFSFASDSFAGKMDNKSNIRVVFETLV